MRIEYALSEKEFLEAQRLHGGWSFRFLPMIGGLLMLAGIFRLVQDPQHLCFSSIILSPPNGNVKMSPHERKDIRVESEGTATSERNFQLR